MTVPSHEWLKKLIEDQLKLNKTYHTFGENFESNELKNNFKNVTIRKRRLQPLTLEERLKDLPSIYTQIPSDRAKKIEKYSKLITINQIILILVKLNTILMTTSPSDLKNNRSQNLFRNLQKDPRRINYSVANLSRSILNKERKSTYNKDNVFVNLCNKLEDKNFYQNNNLPLVTPFVNKRSNVDHLTLYSISKPLELLHADIVDLRFFAKSAVVPKYCLLIVDLFSSKIYVYPIKNRSFLAKKLKLFYEDIKQKRTGRICLQTDLEF